jgi:hypothetical protein
MAYNYIHIKQKYFNDSKAIAAHQYFIEFAKKQPKNIL